MDMSTAVRGRVRGEGGFALILAVLALVLLTLLGLTLTTVSTDELGMAANYRWHQEARANAEAGVEAGREILRSMDWAAILPPARAQAWTGGEAPPYVAPDVNPGTSGNPDGSGHPLRQFELGPCDGQGNGAGFGVVLDDGSPAGPFQRKADLLGRTLGGHVTLWVRRPQIVNPDGTLSDRALNDAVVLTAEGTAPGTGPNNARYLMEVTIEGVQASVPGGCESQGGQVGNGPGGAGFAPCTPLSSAGLIPALGVPNQGDLGSLDDSGAN